MKKTLIFLVISLTMLGLYFGVLIFSIDDDIGETYLSAYIIPTLLFSILSSTVHAYKFKKNYYISLVFGIIFFFHMQINGFLIVMIAGVVYGT